MTLKVFFYLVTAYFEQRSGQNSQESFRVEQNIKKSCSHIYEISVFCYKITASVLQVSSMFEIAVGQIA